MIDFSMYLKSDDDIGGKERYVLPKSLRFRILTNNFLIDALFFIETKFPKNEMLRSRSLEENSTIRCSLC